MNRDSNTSGNNPDSWGKTALVTLGVVILVGACVVGAVWLGIV